MRNKRDRSITPGVYRHFKGGYYCVLCMAVHTETGENLVIYQELYGERRVFARPIDMFLQSMDELKRQYEVAVQDLEMIMFKGKENIDTCVYCRNDRCYVRGGRDCCNPIWRGRDNTSVTEKPCLIPYTGEP